MKTNKNKLKLFIDARCTIIPFSGISRWTLSLIDHLVSVKNYELCLLFHVTCRSEDHPLNWYINELETAPGVVVEYSKVNPFSLNLFYKIKRSQCYDVVLYPHYDIPIYLKDRRSKKICVVHDLMPISVYDYIQKYRFYKQKYFLIRLILSYFYADQVICVSKQTKSDFIKYVGFGEKKISVCYPGLNRVHNESHKKFDIKVPGKFNLYIGDRRRHKNLNRLIQLHVCLWKDYNMSEDLVICGQPKNFEKLVDVEPSLARRIHFYTNVDDVQLYKLLDLASSLMLLSKYEGLGLPVLEAGSRGKKVILSDGGALKEIAPEGSLMLRLAQSESYWARQVFEYLSSERKCDQVSIRKIFTWDNLTNCIEYGIGKSD